MESLLQYYFKREVKQNYFALPVNDLTFFST